MKRTLLLAFVAAFVTAGLVLAQAKPDFSGAWTLDPSKSEMGRMGGGPGGGGMGEMTVVIKQTASELSIERKMGETVSTTVYKLDGTESVNKGPRGGEVKSTAKWDGANLVIKSTQEGPQGGTMESTEVRGLSADGKVMTVDVTRQTPKGEMKQKMVFNKK
jgi:polyisoprenoid-binding protein YceI